MATTASPMLDVALQAAAAGLAVVPPRQDGTKRPDAAWRRYEHTAPTCDQLTRWYAAGDRTGIGIVCGAVSGNLELLEFEGRARDLWRPFVRACADRGLAALLDRVIDGYAETTPGGGVHLLYRCTEPVGGNLKLARSITTGDTDEVQVLIETRGEGGYVVIAPSNGPVHPTGRGWELLRGGFDSIATITADERAQLHATARLFDQMPERPPRVDLERPIAPPPAATTDSWMDQVVADFNAATTWADILEPTGWSHSHRHGDIDYWTRPGKEPKDGHSATTNANGTDRLIVFSSSVAGFETADGNGPAPSYDRFGAWAVLEHHGDRLEAARAAREAGHGPAWQPAERIDPADLLPDTPTPADTDPDTAVGSSWRPTPLADLVHGLTTGTLQRPTPTIGRLTGGDHGLWYPGRVNGLYGEPGEGKTWIALCVAAEQLEAGHAVAWIDLEEPAQGIVARLLELSIPGATIVDRFAHFAPEETIRHARALETALAQLHPSLVVIDSTGEALALEGAKPNNDDEVATWFRTWPRWIANTTGAAVVVIDHVIKDENTRGLWPGGSQRKKAAINGSAFMATTINRLARGTEGRLKLITSKDRQGHHRGKAAEFVLDATAHPLRWRLEPPARPARTDEPFRPTVLMERISRALETADGPLSKRRLADAVKGKSEYRAKALETLVAEHYVSVELLDREHICSSIRPYRETDDLLPPAEDDEDEMP